jgi:hypothetical protein
MINTAFQGINISKNQTENVYNVTLYGTET